MVSHLWTWHTFQALTQLLSNCTNEEQRLLSKDGPKHRHTKGRMDQSQKEDQQEKAGCRTITLYVV